MKRKLTVSFMLIALAAALVGGATFALFTDETYNNYNTFSAGTVDVVAGDQTYSVAIDNMAPGDTISGSFTVTNTGSLKQWFKVTAITTGNLFSGNTPAIVSISNGDWTELDATDPDTSVTINYTVHLPIEANNDYQGVSGGLQFKVDAEQFANNPNPAGVNP